MKTENQQITFQVLDSGDKALDSIYFIKFMFVLYHIKPETQLNILEYLKQESLSEISKPITL